MPGVLRIGETDHDVKSIDRHEVFIAAGNDRNRAWCGPVEAAEMSNAASLMRLWRNEGIQPWAVGKLVDEAEPEHSPCRAVFATKGASDRHPNLLRLGS